MKQSRLESHQVFNVKIPMTEIFKIPTIKELSKYIRQSVKETYISIEVAEKKEYYRLSSAQKRLYILQQMDESGTAYNIPAIIPLREKIDIKKLESVFQNLVTRHSIFRTSLEMVGKEPVQRVHESVEFNLEHYDLKKIAPGDNPPSSPREVEKIIEGFIRPFELNCAPLIRAGIIKNPHNSSLLLLDIHHTISDGTSMELLEKEFMRLYSGQELEMQRIDYKDYAQWQKKPEQRESLERQEKYWLEIFAGQVPVLNLPTDFPRPIMQSFAGSTIEFLLTVEESRVLKDLVKQTGATLYMCILSVFTILLSRLSGQEDIIVGTPIAIRTHVDLEKIIGMFINTLAMRNTPLGEMRYREYLEELKERTIKTYENQEYPFEELVENISVSRDTSRNPVFDVMFNLLNVGEYNHDTPGPDQKEQYLNRHRKRTSKFDLTLTVVEPGERLLCTIEYCTLLFKPETINRFISYFKRLLYSLSVTSDVRLFEIEMISQEEKHRVLAEFNATGTDYPRDKTIHQLFEEQVEKTPDNIAVVGQSITTIHESALCITYREMNEKSARLASFLIKKVVQPETIVAIMLERSVEMMVWLMGILKAGCAYLPIDQDYPEERRKFILADSETDILLTEDAMDNWNPFSNHGQLESGSRGSADSLAYVLYTSGTTGKPKGVMIEHRSVINFIKGITDVIPFTPGDCSLSLTTLSFDIFGSETILPLTKGSKVVIGSREEQLDAERIAFAIERNHVNILQLIPTRLKLILADKNASGSLERVNYLLVGGEAFPESLLKSVKSVTGGKIYNVYGPTETTIYSTIRELTGENVIDIGKPIANTQVYILNKNDGLQTVEAVGELCIGGVGLARGYINSPELSAEKFVPFAHQLNEFHKYENENSKLKTQNLKLYRTGDLARWLENGNIDFLGRIDHQVKIRGFRIELGEIEKCLLKVSGVKEAVLLVREEDGGDKYIYAYFVADREYGISELREHLSMELPAYMLPSYFVPLEKIPLTPNWKIDRRALLQQATFRPKSDRVHVAPEKELEIKIASIWNELLHLEKVGIYDDFFELGGNSLKITQLKRRLTEELNKNIPVVSLFQYTTIGSFVEYLKKSDKQKTIISDNFDRSEKFDRVKRTHKNIREKRRKSLE